MAYVSRDPFARQEVHKTRVRGASCAWCGRSDGAKSACPCNGTHYGPVYRFRVESDGGRRFEDRETFCSKSCRASYHG